jgi:hypothetical protein
MMAVAAVAAQDLSARFFQVQQAVQVVLEFHLRLLEAQYYAEAAVAEAQKAVQAAQQQQVAVQVQETAQQETAQLTQAVAAVL